MTIRTEEPTVASPTFDGTAEAIAHHFDDFALDYDAAAFEGAGMAHLSALDLAVVRAACDLARGRTGGRRAVDVGVGTGRIVGELLAAGFEVAGVEASSAMRARTRARFPAVSVDAGALPDRLPLPDASFDLVTAMRVLKYVRAWPIAVAELSRLARPGGIVCFDLANAWSPARFGYPPGMVWTARRGTAERALEAAGLRILELRPGVHLPDPLWRAADGHLACAVARGAERVLGAGLGRHGARSWTFVCERT
jgi:SAM-dependent methyltransferase